MSSAPQKKKMTKSATLTKKKSGSSKSKKAKPITDFNSAYEWLLEHVDHERLRVVPYNEDAFNLDRMREILDLLDSPHEQLRCIQVAGTNGKGSTCAMLKSMLRACGYTVGMYTSPHLVDIRERIAVDDEFITRDDFTDLMKLLQEKTKGMEERPSFFEILTAAGLAYFAEQAVDIVILETGLGGRLDCTSVVTPLICALTKISYDHQNVLGKDLASIAKEKAGIFKPGVSVISVEQEPEVTAVLDEVAQSLDAPLKYTGSDIDFSFRFEANRELGPHSRVSVTTQTSKWEHLAVPLKGEHQAYNCGLALAILDKLKEHSFHLPEERIVAGLAATRIAGRMEQVWDSPRVIVDGAHNAAAIQSLIRALGAHVQYDSLVMIFGCAQDKDVTALLKQVALGADKVIFTRAKLTPRSVEPELLLSEFSEHSSKMSQSAPNMKEALKLAARAVSREDIILITGSFYLAGEAKKHFDDKKNKLKNG